MLHIFEIFIEPGTDIEAILSDETKRETHAQMMTVDQAIKVGLKGIAADGPERAVIAVNARDGRWIQRVLEASAVVASFRVMESD